MSIAIPAEPILAQATVDQIRFGSFPMWSVEVNGLSPFAHRRTYDIEAKDENAAAQEGIGRFVEEMEALGPDREDR